MKETEIGPTAMKTTEDWTKMKNKIIAFFAIALISAFATKYTIFNKNRSSWMTSTLNDTHFICRDCNRWYDTDSRGEGEVNVCKYCSYEVD